MRLVAPALLIVGALGCAAAQQPAPRMPTYTTENGKACARSCQSTFAKCNGACAQMRGVHRTQCLNNCNTTLSDCYATCE